MSRDALIVGINTYQNLPSLRAPANDAESVARCLESFGECRVLRMPEVIRQKKPVVSSQALVTTKMLEDALIRLFKPAGKTIPQTAFFYYSGHGLQRHAGIQEGYLATSDANPALGHYGLSLYWLRRLLQESPVRQRIVILDCCHSGEFLNTLEADPGAKTGTDRLFMAASREYEEAYEALEGQHSVFTQALLSGLNPYRAKGGVVNAHSLTDAVNRQLKGELQQPLFESSGGEIVMTRLTGATPAMPSSKVTTLDRLKHLSYGFCPFQGSAPFNVAHASLFFGRESITTTLVDQVSEERFCALVGASGCGKTSILRAGLMHRLQQHPVDQPSPWEVRYLVPGPSPVRTLAEVFVDPEARGLQRAEQIRQAEAFLHRGSQGMTQLVQAMTQPHGDQPHRARHLVLIVDQFERMLERPSQPDLAQEQEQEQRLVMESLLSVVQQPHLPVRVVIGLRANYLRELQRYPEVYALVAQHGLLVPAMTYDQLKSTIVGPLEKVGLRYDANLIYTLLLDVVGAAGDLALLQMALKKVWQQREPDPTGQEPPRLTLESYAEMGGIRHLLSRRASQFYGQLPPADQGIAERIFLGLCDWEEGSTLIRRQVQLPELITKLWEEDRVRAVLEHMVTAGLVVAQSPTIPPEASEDTQTAIGGTAMGVDLGADMATEASPTTPPDHGPVVSGQTSLKRLLERHNHHLLCRCPDLTPHFAIVHESLIRTWLPMQVWFPSDQARLRLQRSIEAAAQEWYQQQCPNHPEYFLTRTRFQDAKRFHISHPNNLSIRATSYLQACQSHLRRCAQKGYLMKLLIPLSMGTGMLTAYGHSVITSPSYTWKNHHPVAPATTTAPVFRSIKASTQEPVGASTPDPTSPPAQVGRVPPHLITPTWEPWTTMADPPQPFVSILPNLSYAIHLATKRTWRWEPQPADQPLAAPNLPNLGSLGTHPLQAPFQSAPLTKVAEWTSPTDATVTIQVWCLQSSAEPVCFTLKP